MDEIKKTEWVWLDGKNDKYSFEVIDDLNSEFIEISCIYLAHQKLQTNNTKLF